MKIEDSILGVRSLDPPLKGSTKALEERRKWLVIEMLPHNTTSMTQLKINSYFVELELAFPVPIPNAQSKIPIP